MWLVTGCAQHARQLCLALAPWLPAFRRSLLSVLLLGQDGFSLTGNRRAPQPRCIDIDLGCISCRVDSTDFVALNVDHLIVHDLGIWLEHGSRDHAKVVRLSNQQICIIDDFVTTCSPNRLSIVLLAEDGSEGLWWWTPAFASARDPHISDTLVFLSNYLLHIWRSVWYGWIIGLDG